jgi:hypothetical protein
MSERATEEPPISDAARRVAEALIEGSPPPPDARAALTPLEQAEIAALVRTARLTYLALHQPEPGDAAEESAWAKAKDALQSRPLATPAPEDVPPRWRAWLDRLLNRGNGDK